MRKYFKNKRVAALSVSVLATTLILTGTFAWSVRLFSTTGGLGEDYHYIVKLLDMDTDPLFVINKWEDEKLDKKVYATSSYNVEDIAKQYDKIIEKDSNSLFRDTWVRIKLEETFMRNGTITITTITEKLGDTLKSSVADGKYFTFDTIEDTDIILLSNWDGNHGRFWILDEDTGWLYWAQPLLATTELGDSDSEIEDQTTDHIIDEVSLANQPAGVWEYTIKATLEAMDVELQGYTEEGAWNDIDETHDIYPLFGDIEINPTNFPNDTFRTWIMDNLPEARDGILTQKEISTITDLDMSNQELNQLEFTGINYFKKLESLDVSRNYLRTLDISDLTNLNVTTLIYEPQYHNRAGIPLILGTDTESRKEWLIDTNRYDQDLNVLVNAYNFPDSDFLIYIKTDTITNQDDYDTNYIEDGMISQENLAKVTRININGKNMVNLVGIEHFENLKELRVSNMPNLNAIDVSNNEAMTRLYAYNNQLLTSIELRSKPLLSTLQVQNNQLSRLDIAGCTNATFRNNILNTTNFSYDPQKKADGVTSKTLKTTVTAETNIIEWE